MAARRSRRMFNLTLGIVLTISLFGCGQTEAPTLVIQSDSMGQSSGFVTNNGRPLRATELPLEFYAHQNVPDFLAQACARAAGTLNESVERELVLIHADQKYSEPILSFREPPYLLTWTSYNAHRPEHQATTDLMFLGEQLVGAKVRFNNRNVAYSDLPDASSIDAESVCLHELGHALGLGHNSDPESVMYPSLARGQIRRALSAQDRARLRSAYPLIQARSY